MALVHVVNMAVLDNPTTFSNPFQFEITFECLQSLDDDLEWKVVYVGSAEDSSMDQILEEVLVGPVPVGINKFVLQADAPDPKTIPENDIIGVTVLLVTCSFKDQEFLRVGYYVNNEYSEEYDPDVGPPKPLNMSKVTRHILADKPRVTRFPIDWKDCPGSGTTPDKSGHFRKEDGVEPTAVVEDYDMDADPDEDNVDEESDPDDLQEMEDDENYT